VLTHARGTGNDREWRLWCIEKGFEASHRTLKAWTIQQLWHDHFAGSPTKSWGRPERDQHRWGMAWKDRSKGPYWKGENEEPSPARNPPLLLVKRGDHLASAGPEKL
jgi:hypothetical protein